MARLFALLTLVLIASMTQAERVDFSSMIAAAGTECYLENIGETINGKLLSSLIERFISVVLIIFLPLGYSRAA